MRPSFYPRLINGRFDDPGLYIPFQFEKQAILFDLGDISALSPRDLLKVSHVYVTHTHMDHFCGFDHLLRLLLGREKKLYLYGPTGFLSNLEGKLAGYTWNLVNKYNHPFSIQAAEIRGDQVFERQYRCEDAFQATSPVLNKPFTGALTTKPSFTVSAINLDHKIDCLGFRIEEQFHINIIKERLTALGLSVGPWLRQFKQAIYNKEAPNTQFVIPNATPGPGSQVFELQALSNEIARISQGQKIAYIADMIGSSANSNKVISFARGVDHLFIEASFLDKDRAIARKKYHLTAKEAGLIAKQASVKQFTIFHFSPRYTGMAEALEAEAMEAFTA